MKFLLNVLAVLVGMFIFTMTFFFGIFLIGVFASAGGNNDDSTRVRNNSVIELDLAHVTLDYGGKSFYKDFDYSETNHDGVSDIIKAIEYAKTDNKIKGISMLNHTSELGIAQTKALRDALEDFKDSGKFVVAYSNFYTQKDYYLGSVADTVYVNPVGLLEFKGLSTEVMYFKDLQDKSGVNVEVVRHGKYKSAVEPFIDNKMSDANREQISTLLNSVWNSMLKDISKSRNIPVEKLNEIALNVAARTPEMAKSQNLIDQIAYEDSYHNAIKKALKINGDKDYETVKILDYARKVATTARSGSSTNRIAIIYAQGEILSGEGSETYIGDGAMRRAIKEAREDDDVKAIVLRIDSPGGSALTAELIWREIELTKKVKPVVVSMGNLAASGGYYIACNADEIYAEENTITGSIGVFGMLPNFTNLATKVGVHTERVATHDNGADYSPFLPLDSKYRNLAQEQVETIYTTFVNRVATGRKMTFQQVDDIGQGRVWSGTDALRIGLVDKIGGLDAAIASAAAKAKLKDYSTRNYPEYEKNFSDLLRSLGIPFVGTKESLLKEELGEENYMILDRLRKVSAEKGIRARMSYELNIH
jgi:protease-4